MANPQSEKFLTNMLFIRDEIIDTQFYNFEQKKILNAILTDEVVYNYILPSFETVFVGRDFHRSQLFF
jgi:hypothetical protein